jgi:hypothetical protein
MPDKDGKLTPEDRQKVIEWMGAHGKGDPRCPICLSEKWMIAEFLVQPMTIGGNHSLQLGGGGLPNIVLISDPCGYTRYLNAVLVGLVEGGKKD